MRSIDKKTGQSSKQPKKDPKKKSDLLAPPSFTPEELIKLGKQYAGLESPIDISFPILTDAFLRPLEWVNFEKSPKRMKISNSGTTAILSAKWHGPRPYLAKGPLAGYYVFSQLHFHWGSSLDEGSEHTMDGKSLPLEVHVMFFKNSYLTQEDAMKQVDGTVTVAYLFTLQNTDNEDFNPIISALKEIQRPLTSYHLELLPLEKFLYIFTEDYFMYWGNVVNRSILWLICRKPLGISQRQLSLFHSMTGINERPITKNFRGTKEINHRTVYHINPSNYRSDLLFGIRRDSRLSSHRKPRSVSKSIVGTGDGTLKSFEITNDGSVEKRAQNPKEESIFINISVLADDHLERKNSVPKVEEPKEVNRVDTSPSNNEAINLEKRRKSQIKFQLASALLNLEKEEGNDYAFLEKYLRSNFDTLQQDEHYRAGSDEEQGGGKIHASSCSLRMNSDIDASNVSEIKDKSKSETNCFKNYMNSDDDSVLDLEESKKVGWSSSMNNISDKECRNEGEGAVIPPTRPKTCSAKLEDPSRSVLAEAEARVPTFRSSSKLSQVAPQPAVATPTNRPVLIRKTSSERDKAKKGTLREPNDKSSESKVDEARDKIRLSLKQSMSRLGKFRGSPTKDPSKNQKPDSRSRPAWRY